MSTLSDLTTYQFSVPSSDLVMATPSERSVVYSYGETFPRTESGVFRPVTKSKTRLQRSLKGRTLRRLKGFLVESYGAEVRVAFVENGETIMYDMPAEQLRKAGIELRNQPFEMDEIEVDDGQGTPITGYRFKRVATAVDAYNETLNFDDARKLKRDLILKKFGKPQS